MAFRRVSLKAHKTGRAPIDQRPQFPELFLRFGLREVFIVNPAKLIKAPGTCSVATFFRVAECAEMDVLHSLPLDPNAEPVFGEAFLARQRQRPDIGQKVNANGLERGDEPINVGALIANRVERGHGQINSNLMLCCSALVKVSLQAFLGLPRLKQCGPGRICFFSGSLRRGSAYPTRAARRDGVRARAPATQKSGG